MDLIYALRSVVSKFIAHVVQIHECEFYDYGITVGFKQRPGGRIMLAEFALLQGRSLSIQFDPKANTYKVRFPAKERKKNDKGKTLESVLEVTDDDALATVIKDYYVGYMEQIRNDLMRFRKRRERSRDNRAEMENMFFSIQGLRKDKYAARQVKIEDGPLAGMEVCWAEYMDETAVLFDDAGKIALELKNGALLLEFKYKDRMVFRRKARSVKAVRSIVDTGIVDVRKKVSSKAV